MQRTAAILFAAAALAAGTGVAAAPTWVVAQVPGEAPNLSTGSASTPRKAGKPPATLVAAAESQPTWAALSPAQRQALAPLAASWPSLTEGHKRKWIALSVNYPNMRAEEQALLHSRMTGWAALTPQQRARARLNFAESKKVPADDRKAKWQAYQQLPDDEKRKLAAGAAAAKPAAPSAAAAVQPVPRQKLAKVPARKDSARTPRIAAAPNQVDHNTLLPQPGATLAPHN
jgi:hypothetical protein